MQTTLRIDDAIYQQAKTRASQLGISLTRLFEDALEQHLSRLDARGPRKIILPVSTARGPVLSEEEYRRRIESADLAHDLARIA